MIEVHLRSSKISPEEFQKLFLATALANYTDVFLPDKKFYLSGSCYFWDTINGEYRVGDSAPTRPKDIDLVVEYDAYCESAIAHSLNEVKVFRSTAGKSYGIYSKKKGGEVGPQYADYNYVGSTTLTCPNAVQTRHLNIIYVYDLNQRIRADRVLKHEPYRTLMYGIHKHTVVHELESHEKTLYRTFLYNTIYNRLSSLSPTETINDTGAICRY